MTGFDSKRQMAMDELVATQEALGMYDDQKPQQEPVANTLHFAQWTTPGKKDLSDYICVGSLTLAGIEDGEYGQSEIDPFENIIEALQEKMVNGHSYKIPLLAYIGPDHSIKAQPQQREWVGLTDDDMPSKELDAFCRGARWAAAKLKEKNFDYFGDLPDGTHSLYTAPQQHPWVGLTDEERSELVTLHHGWNAYGQAIEAKLKEKNT